MSVYYGFIVFGETAENRQFWFYLRRILSKVGYAPISRPSYAVVRYAPDSRGRLTRPTYALYLRLG